MQVEESTSEAHEPTPLGIKDSMVGADIYNHANFACALSVPSLQGLCIFCRYSSLRSSSDSRKLGNYDEGTSLFQIAAR